MNPRQIFFTHPDNLSVFFFNYLTVPWWLFVYHHRGHLFKWHPTVALFNTRREEKRVWGRDTVRLRKKAARKQKRGIDTDGVREATRNLFIDKQSYRWCIERRGVHSILEWEAACVAKEASSECSHNREKPTSFLTIPLFISLSLSLFPMRYPLCLLFHRYHYLALSRG